MFIARVELFALDVFSQGQFQELLIRHGAHDRGDPEQSGLLRRGQPALPGDQLESPAQRPDQNRLQDAVFADRGSQLVERLRVEVQARLNRIWIDLVYVYFCRGSLDSLDFGQERP